MTSPISNVSLPPTDQTTLTIQHTPRISSIDTLRGLAIILMALDHVRDYWCPTAFSPTDLDQTWPALFFTRRITHLCPPAFIFLAGIGVWLYQANRQAKPAAVARFLLSRGIWLIFLELTWNLEYLLLDLPV